MNNKKYIETYSYNTSEGADFNIKIFDHVEEDEEIVRIRKVGEMGVSVKTLKKGENCITTSESAGEQREIVSHPFILEKATTYMEIRYMKLQDGLLNEALKIAHDNNCEAIMFITDCGDTKWFTERGFKKVGSCFIVKKI